MLSEFFKTIQDVFKQNPYAGIFLDAIFLLFMVCLIVFLAFKFRKAFNLILIGLIMVVIYLVSDFLDLVISENVYFYAFDAYIIICVVIIAPELRKFMEFHKRDDSKKNLVLSSTQATKEAIVDAVFNLSANKVGALITIEHQMSLEQYSERAITLNSDVSKELLEQIFIKDSPLHDGGVIIRGNKIICAAAYYTLTQDQTIDKTVGSRHRAGMGISEISDSVTIIVSEETGNIHFAHSGFMEITSTKNELFEYLDLYLGH